MPTSIASSVLLSLASSTLNVVRKPCIICRSQGTYCKPSVEEDMNCTEHCRHASMLSLMSLIVQPRTLLCLSWGEPPQATGNFTGGGSRDSVPKQHRGRHDFNRVYHTYNKTHVRLFWWAGTSTGRLRQQCDLTAVRRRFFQLLLYKFYIVGFEVFDACVDAWQLQLRCSYSDQQRKDCVCMYPTGLIASLFQLSLVWMIGSFLRLFPSILAVLLRCVMLRTLVLSYQLANMNVNSVFAVIISLVQLSIIWVGMVVVVFFSFFIYVRWITMDCVCLHFCRRSVEDWFWQWPLDCSAATWPIAPISQTVLPRQPNTP